MPKIGDRSATSWTSSISLPDYVASLYYRYGIFVASNPIKVISFAFTSFFLLSTPLWYLPFPGYLPQDYVTSLQNYTVPPPAPEGGLQLSPSTNPAPLWYQSPPVAYIQQIIIRSTVTPWEKGITVGESVRAPLYSVFHLSQIISDFQLEKVKNLSVSLSSECLLVEGVVQNIKTSGHSLPNFNCLMLSPADLWGRDPQVFLADQNVFLTVKSLKGKHEEETSIADILFGLPSKDIGISSVPTHPQVITYAITIALKKYSDKFIYELEKELVKRFPLHQPVDPPRQFITHVYFPSKISFWEFLILIFYCFLFSSIYFSFLKMEGLYSKCGLAISIMATLIASLCIAASVSAHFGLRPLQSKGKYFYPVLAALVGFENSMVLVRSVLSSAEHLDVKIRVAQGLAREGWTITKYFLSMITFVTVSFFLFIPLVQEICIYGSLVLLCDLYFQLIFVTAVLAVDMQRCQNTDNHRRSSQVNPLFRFPVTSPQEGQLARQDNVYKTCVPNLHRRHTMRTRRGEDILAPPKAKPQPPEKIPKRLRLTYFVVKKRMFQRMFMCTFVGWIAWMVYSSELVHHVIDPINMGGNRDLAAVIFSLTNRSSNANLTSINPLPIQKPHRPIPFPLASNSSSDINFNVPKYNESSKWSNQVTVDSSKISKKLLHKTRTFARRLPISHWPVLFSYYNISLRGHYLSILPPILLSLPISPENAKSTSNPLDPYSMEWIPQYVENDANSNYEDWQEEFAIVPSSNVELFITAVLVIPALAVLVYATIALYRCICSRNYAEWRSANWSKDSFHAETSQIIGEAVPLVLAEHPHDVECLSTDGSIVVSSCLAGIICAWDPVTGECIATINRCQPHKSNMSSEDISYSSSASSNECCCQDDCFKRNSIIPDKSGSEGSLSPFPSLPSSQSFPSLSALPNLSSVKNIKSENVSQLKNINLLTFPSDSMCVCKDFQLKEAQNTHLKKSPDQVPNDNSYNVELSSSYTSKYSTNYNQKCRHSRNLSLGNLPQNVLPIISCQIEDSPYRSEKGSVDLQCSPIWCMECQDGFVYIGTGRGVLEVWDVYSSSLKCFHDDGSGIGVTSIKVSGSRVVAARLNGLVEILCTELISFQDTDNKTPVENGNSNDVDGEDWMINGEEIFKFIMISSVKAHQQPITVLTCDKTRIITGSHDHTLKVLSIIDGNIMFTLHGHYGPLTTVSLGKALEGNNSSSVGIAVEFGGVGSVIASGAQDGSLCVWDLLTGTCVYSVQAHDGSIVALTCTSSYILSLGADDKLCVWERFQGHLLNTLIMSQMYCSCMIMLTNRLLITSQQGSLTVWDIASGTPIRLVRLGDHDQTIFIKYLLPVAGSIVCDYGNQLRVVRLPVAEKLD